MLKESYILPTNKESVIDILWVGNWKYTIVEYDGKNIGVFSNIKELKEGREFSLNYNEKVFIKLNGLIHPKLEVTYNENKITSSSKLPTNIIKQTYNLAFLIGFVNVAAGFIPLIFKQSSFDSSNIMSLILGGIIVFLASKVKKKSRVSLLLICIILMTDILFLIYQIHINSAYLIYAVIKSIILYSLIDGYKAMKVIK